MKLLWLFLLFALSVLPARADRDIVYAVRYYYPPGDPRASHFHLYRINPDGTGRIQITFGLMDEEAPQWSPDGKQILFLRGNTALCVLPANGGPVRAIVTFPAADALGWVPFRWLPDARTVAVVHSGSRRTGTENGIWLVDSVTGARRQIRGASGFWPSPDGRRAYLPGDAGDGLRETASGASVPVQDPLISPVWLDKDTLIGLAGAPEHDGYFLRKLGTDGREQGHQAIRLPDSLPSLDGIPRETTAWLKATPNPRRRLVYALNNHNSTVGANYVFLTLDPASGQTEYLADGQFLAWSPDGARFCVAPGRALAVYSHRRDGTERTVWVAPLQVGTIAAKTPKAITSGLVWVTGADWRQQPKSRG